MSKMRPKELLSTSERKSFTSLSQNERQFHRTRHSIEDNNRQHDYYYHPVNKRWDHFQIESSGTGQLKICIFKSNKQWASIGDSVKRVWWNKSDNQIRINIRWRENGQFKWWSIFGAHSDTKIFNKNRIECVNDFQHKRPCNRWTQETKYETQQL